jgi:hypothetical protein
MRKLILWALLLNAGLALGQVYSWRDAQGGVHYSDQPPTDADAQRMNVPTASGDSAVNKSWQDQNKDFNKRQAAAAEADKKAASEAQQAETKRSNCQQARNNLQGIESGQIRYRMGTNGEREALDGDVRDAALARARAAVDSWCN